MAHKEPARAPGWQPRRHYDMRAAFISLAIEDGANTEAIRTRVMHAPKSRPCLMATTGAALEQNVRRDREAQHHAWRTARAHRHDRWRGQHRSDPLRFATIAATNEITTIVRTALGARSRTRGVSDRFTSTRARGDGGSRRAVASTAVDCGAQVVECCDGGSCTIRPYAVSRETEALPSPPARVCAFYPTRAPRLTRMGEGSTRAIYNLQGLQSWPFA